MKAVHVDDDLHEKDDHKHKYGEEVVERERHPDALSGSVVVGKKCLDHREEGDAHGCDDENMELNSKTVVVVLLYKPIKTHQQNSLDHQLSKRLSNGL